MERDRTLYHQLINIDQQNDVRSVLQSARDFLEEKIREVEPSSKFFEYSEKNLDQFLAKDSLSVQERYEEYLKSDPKPRSKEEMKMYLKQLTPAKYVDGAWLQGIAKAHNIRNASSLHSQVINILFNIYTEELGEGQLNMNHVEIWKDLLGNLGISMPEPASKAFESNPEMWDSSFTVGTIQLALGTLSTEFLPEILGYNMGFEQLPLHLMTTVDEMRKLGMDPYYFQLHISIDNGATGHAAMATTAVKLYLDDVINRFGEKAMEDTWRRVLIGVALNELNPMKIQYNRWIQEPQVETQQDLNSKVVDIVKSKAIHSHKLHGTCEINGKKLNDWMNPENSDEEFLQFVDVLAESNWIKPSKEGERPGESFLNGICGFGGPMFHIFTRSELNTLQKWADFRASKSFKAVGKCPFSKKASAGQESSAGNPHLPMGKQEEIASNSALQMLRLIEEKSSRAKRGHGRRTLNGPNGENKTINEWFSGNPLDLMTALSSHYDFKSMSKKMEELGSIEEKMKVIETCPLISSSMCGGMKNFFNESEIQIMKNWILNGATLPSALLMEENRIEKKEVSEFKSVESIETCPVTQTNPTTQKEKNEISIQLSKEIKPKTFFHRLINYELYPDVWNQSREFLTSLFKNPSDPMEFIQREPSIILINNKTPLSSKSIDPLNGIQSVNRIVKTLQSSEEAKLFGEKFHPFVMLEGIVVQNVNNAGFHHHQLNTKINAIFMKIWGYEEPLNCHFHFYDNLLRTLRVCLPEINTQQYCDREEFSPSSIRFSLLQLSASLHHREYFPEILGILDWTLQFNRSVQESLIAKLDSLGIYNADPVQWKERMEEYQEMQKMSREAIQMFVDESKVTTDPSASQLLLKRMWGVRNICDDLAQSFATETEKEIQILRRKNKAPLSF